MHRRSVRRRRRSFHAGPPAHTIASTIARLGEWSPDIDASDTHGSDTPDPPRTALVCPGQGAQRPGGVVDLPESARATFDRASAEIGVDLWEAGLTASADAIARPSLLQPLLVAWAVADYARATEQGGRVPAPDFVLGHSSGQNSALVLSGALPFETAVRFAHQRGLLQDAACDADAHGLLAVSGLDEAAVDALAAARGLVVANRNASDQFVLAGRDAQLAQAASDVEARGGAGCGCDWRARSTATTSAGPTSAASR